MSCFISAFTFVMVVASSSPEKPNLQPNYDMRCGLYCLAVGLSALGEKSYTLERLEANLGPPEAMGYSLSQLADAAKKEGFETLSVRSSLANLSYRRNSLGERFSCIASYGPDHFVLIYGSDGKIVRIADPPRTSTLDIPVFEREWNGNCLLIGKKQLSNEETILASRRTHEIILRIGAVIGSILLVAGVSVVISWLRNRARKDLVMASILILAFCGCADRNGDKVKLSETPTYDASNVIRGDQIEVIPAWHSLGVVRGGQGRTLPIVSRIRNTSDEPLRIAGVNVSCACTEASLDKRVIQPGETVELKSNIKIGESQSPRSALINIVSNDRLRPVSEIKIDWVADLPMKTEPTSIERFELLNDALNEFEVAVISKFVSLCEKCEVRTSNASDFLTLNWIPNMDIQRIGHHSAQSQETFETRLGTLKAKVVPIETDLHHREEIEILLTCSGETIATTQLPMTWTFRRSFGVVPSRVFFGTLKSGKPSSQSIVVKCMNDERLVIRSIRLQSESLPLDTKIDRASDSVSRIALTISAPSKLGPWTDEIVIETDSKAQPVIRVPVSCLVE